MVGGIVSTSERRLIADQRKIETLRERIVQVSYLKASEVRRHLHMSRPTLDAIPAEVLPWVPGNGGARIERRYHPSDVAAYPARARRWRDGIQAGKEAEVLAAMREELAERDRGLIEDALRGTAA